MSVLLYAGGLIIGVVGFLYLSSFLKDATEKLNKKSPPIKEQLIAKNFLKIHL